MRLVMGGESLEGPLTGIGQYTYHLAQEIISRGDIPDFKFLVHGRLKEVEKLLRTGQMEAGEVAPHTALLSTRFLNKLRTQAAQNKIAVGLYDRIMPLREHYSLNRYSQHDVFHSPNYVLPHFPGKRVVSILDLSTLHFPEQHPEARVHFVNSHISRAIKHADHIITISENVRQEIIERFKYDEDRITTTYLGASDKFRPLDKAEFDQKLEKMPLEFNQYFLFASTIEPRKNLDRLLDAYAAYKVDNKDAAMPLAVVGHSGWNSEKTHKRLEALKNDGSVYYFGYFEQALLPALFAGARALVYPSLYEGFGLPVLEAMQSGTAVITSKNTTMEEVGGAAVKVIDPFSTEEIADALTLLSLREQLVDTLATRGIARATQFSWETCANQTISIYSRTLND